MEALGLKELRTTLAFLKDLYAGRDLRSFQTHILSALPRLIPSEITSYNEVNPQARRSGHVSVPVTPSEYYPVFARHVGDHPLITHYRKTCDGRALKISDFLAQRQFHRLGLYNEFFRLLRVEYQMAVTLPAPPPLVVGIALNRSGRDFSEGERQLLNLLRPHLIQAYQNAETVTRMQKEQALTQQALDKLSYGIIGLTRDERIQLTNARAVRMLEVYFGGSSQRGDRLPDELERWAKHGSAVATRAQSLGLPRAPLVMERGGRRLIVRLIGGADDTLLLLEEQVTALSRHSLLSLGLTRRETEVLTWVAQGKTNAEVAAILGTSPYTAIKHLQHIFEKFGVKTRTAAAAYALKATTLPSGHE
ncbi:MAG TPA: helix-turn-helix transcriptional regulator [Candidatus Acidoferrales bacterium]|nr:helix-turn-helix transcriptional regulator [Candidatus Acidoferrales bacterium]